MHPRNTNPTRQLVAPSMVRSGASLHALFIQIRVINALVLRFLMTRYGRANIGFVWVVLEPMILSVGVMMLWSALKPPYEHGVQIVAIVLTGYLPLTLWRHMTGASIHIMRRNMGLIYHKNVTILDAFVGRLLLEFVGSTCAFFTVYAILVTIHVIEPAYDVGLMLTGWFLMGCLSLGFGAILAAATEYSEVVEKFIQPLQYLLIPLSGSFFMVDWLPGKAQEIVTYVPLVHTYETFRAGFFGPSIPTHQDLWYGFTWAFLTICVGFWLMEKARDHIRHG